MRITDQQVTALSQYDMNSAYQALMQAQQQLSTGRRINAPGDDPLGTSTALTLQTSIAQSTAFGAAITDATGFLQTTDTAMTAVNSALISVRSLAVQGANDTNSASDRAALAAQVGQIIAQTVNAANSTYGNRYVLSGTQTGTIPFTLNADSSVTYNGDSNAISPELMAGQTVQINNPGSTALPAAFAAMLQIKNDLQNNLGSALGGADLTTIDTAHSGVLAAQATVGATITRVQGLSTLQTSLQTNMQNSLSSTINIDYGQASITFTSAQTAYQATISAAAKVTQQNLFQFLR